MGGGEEELTSSASEMVVVLNVYDLTPVHNYTVFDLSGHIPLRHRRAAHGKEHGFNAHEFPASGVFEVEPRACPGFIYRLTSRGIPGWVNRLARLGAVCSCILPESLQLTAGKQPPEYHNYSDEDGVESPSTATPHELTEMDDTDQEKHLLSPTHANGGATFIKEPQR